MHVQGDELVYDAVTCAACGAKVREDRPRCLRCGAHLVPAGEGQGRRLPLGTFAVVTCALALVLVGAMLAGRPALPEAASAPAVGMSGNDGRAESSRTSEATIAPDAATTEPPAFAPDPVIVALESRQNGAVAYTRGDLAGALEDFMKAVDAHPEDAEALNNLGQVLVRSGRAKDAIEYFDQAIALAGDRWAYRFNRARAFADLQQWAPAIAGYRDAAELFPDDYVTQFNLARALQASGDLAAAIAGFERTIELAPGEPDFYLAHASVLDKAQRPADASAAYRQYLELDPASPQAEKIKARIGELEGTVVAAARP